MLETELIHKYKTYIFEFGYNTFKPEYKDDGTLIKYHRVEPTRLVHCIETDRYYPSAREAARQTNLDYSNISKVCRGENKTCGKLHWEYVAVPKEEEEQKNFGQV